MTSYGTSRPNRGEFSTSAVRTSKYLDSMTSPVTNVLPVGLRMAPFICIYLRGNAFVLCYSTRTLQGADARLRFHLRSSFQFCSQDLTGSGRGTVPTPPHRTAGLFPRYRLLKADSHIACRAHAVPMPRLRRSPAMPFVNSNMPCRAPALLR